MTKWLNGLFSENGTVSMMRLMSIICCIAAVVIAIMGIEKPIVDYSGISLVVSVFLSAAFGGKVMQKRIEVSGAKSDITAEMNSSIRKTEDQQPPDQP